jgi:hypothetical protein
LANNVMIGALLSVATVISPSGFAVQGFVSEIKREAVDGIGDLSFEIGVASWAFPRCTTKAASIVPTKHQLARQRTVPMVNLV